MRNRNQIVVLVLLVAAVMWAPSAMALPVLVPDFSSDPSGPEFDINPIPWDEGLSDNLLPPGPLLTYDELDPVSNTDDVLVMSWEPENVNEPAKAGWELLFKEDPDLTNETISLSINPPGVGGPGPPAGIIHLEVVIIDVNGLSVGGWGFNTDQMGLIPLGNDPNLSGIAPVAPPIPLVFPTASLEQNMMQTVSISVGAGPSPGSAQITGGSAGTLIGPNYLLPATAGADITKAIKLEFYENGLLAGNQVIPANGLGPLNNYWDHITVTPEPGTMSLLAIGAVAMLRRKRR